MEGAVKKALDGPRAGAEHGLLTGLNEPAPPKLLADNVDGEEGQPQGEQIVTPRLKSLYGYESRVGRQSRPYERIEELQCAHGWNGDSKRKSGGAPIFGAEALNAQMPQDRRKRCVGQRRPSSRQGSGQ